MKRTPVKFLAAAAVAAALVMLGVAGAAAASTSTPPQRQTELRVAGVSWQARSQDSTGIVPSVVDRPASRATADIIRAAGFVVQTEPGWVDCGPAYVQAQWPVGGTSAPLGSTVVLAISRRPIPPNPCP